jgi:hypothetical protein
MFVQNMEDYEEKRGRLAHTDINVPFKRILKILQPNFISNEELWRHSQKKPVAVQLKQRKWIRFRLRKDPSAIAKQNFELEPQRTT